MPRPPRRWSVEEDSILRYEVELQQAGSKGEIKDWSSVATNLPGRSNKDCRKRYYNEVAGGLRKGTWTQEEDERLISLVAEVGPVWSAISQRMKTRNADQCSKRWTHCLDPNIDHSEWTDEENAFLLLAARTHGTSWKTIQKTHMPGRSANTIKNQYNLIQRRGIKIPDDIAPCCQAGVGESSMTNSTSGHSPREIECSVDPSATFDAPNGANFADLPPLDMSSPFSSDLDTLDTSMTNTDQIPNHSSRFPISAIPMNMVGMAADPIPQFNCNSDARGGDPMFAGLELDSQYCSPQSRVHGIVQEDLVDPSRMPDFQTGCINDNGLPLDCSKPQGLGPIDLCGALEPTTASGANSGNRTVITMDNVEPEKLFAVMDILVKSKGNVRVEI